MRSKSYIMKNIILIIFLITCLQGCGSQPVAEEFRAVWLHQTLFDRNKEIADKQIRDLFDSYDSIGINNLFCYYTLKEENGLDWDFLKVIIDEGHKRGIKIHPVFCPGHTIDSNQFVPRHRDWLIRDMDGKYYPNLNLCLPEVRQYWLGVVSQAMKYDIDGIHLDYIRFPVNQRFSYDSVTCNLFKKEYGFTPVEVSHDGGSMIWCEWIKWNEKQVTGLVKEVHDLIVSSGKKIELGADVFPDPAQSRVDIAQNWGEWARQGTIDFVCPMLYTNDTDLFSSYLRDALNIAKGTDCRVYAGLGIGTSHNKITGDLLLKEIRITRSEGSGGFAFFSGYSLNQNFRDILKNSGLKQD